MPTVANACARWATSSRPEPGASSRDHHPSVTAASHRLASPSTCPVARRPDTERGTHDARHCVDARASAKAEAGGASLELGTRCAEAPPARRAGGATIVHRAFFERCSNRHIHGADWVVPGGSDTPTMGRPPSTRRHMRARRRSDPLRDRRARNPRARSGRSWLRASSGARRQLAGGRRGMPGRRGR